MADSDIKQEITREVENKQCHNYGDAGYVGICYKGVEVGYTACIQCPKGKTWPMLSDGWTPVSTPPPYNKPVLVTNGTVQMICKRSHTDHEGEHFVWVIPEPFPPDAFEEIDLEFYGVTQWMRLPTPHGPHLP